MKYMGVLLAAGDGTRMKSKRSKVFHEAAGLPLIEWVMRALSSVDMQTLVVCGENLQEMQQKYGDRAICVEQKERLGSGHAVMSAKEHLENFDGYTIIVAGDMPLLQGKTIKGLIQTAEAGNYDLMMLTVDMQEADATGYGRVIRDKKKNITAIVEEKDATAEEKQITEVNVSCYCVKNHILLNCLDRLRPQNAQGEYYITDIVGLVKKDGGKIGAYQASMFWEGLGVNSRLDLANVEGILRGLIIGQHLSNGVTFVDPQNVYIDADTVIGMDTVIYPGVTLESGCRIGEDVVLYPGSRLVNAAIGDGTQIQNSVILDAQVGKNCSVGPYAYLRPGSTVSDGCRVGDFVELKNATIGEGSKVSHLTYIGDAEVGKNVNVGCGVVFVNYDGKNKYKTTVGDGAFIGCNTNLISPVTIGAGAYIAAGATITEDVPEDAFAIARSRQIVKTEWHDKRKNE